MGPKTEFCCRINWQAQKMRMILKQGYIVYNLRGTTLCLVSTTGLKSGDQKYLLSA